MSSFQPGVGQRMRAEQGRHHDEIAEGEARQEQRRLVREADAAHGGSPLHRAWRRATALLRAEDRG